MAEQNTTRGAASAPMPAAAAKPAEKPRRFTIHAPTPAEGQQPYSGTHPMGIRFIDGVGATDDPIRAHAALEYGFEVLDEATGKPAWPKEPAKTEAKK
ncbi:MAG: hypothetical protein WBD40_10815 [Tepidisphaeraceae bacterium]